MKTRKYFGLLAGLVVVLIPMACEDLLDKVPQSQFTDESLGLGDGDTLKYTTKDQIEAVLSGAYADFKSEYFMLDYFVNGDAQSDDAYAGADNPANFQIDDYEIDATNSNVSRDWGYLYAMISKANSVIGNVELVPDPALTNERKQEMVGEASFIRALAYFELVRLFGDVPLVVQEVTSISAENLEEIYPILYPARNTAEEVFQQIILDLETALPLVPVTAADKGFATRGAVNALLAKVYATIEPHDWTRVNQYCDAVIAGGYSLLDDYDDLWNNSVENSPESILEINCYDWDTGGNWGVFMFAGTDWKKFNIPSEDLVQAFEDEGDDIRRNSSILFENVTGKWTDTHWPASQYPFINKYRDFSGAQNFILIRLADILLLKAEALNELDDPAGAKLLVDQVRDRVDLPPVTATTKEEMRLAIEKERRLELAFEGHRWYDLKRTGRAIDVINSVADENYNLTESGLMWPIPQSERDKNVKLTQNPGY